MTFLFVKIPIFDQEMDFRFDIVNEEMEYIHKKADDADILLKVDYLHYYTISTFLKLCNKMEDDLKNFAKLCVLKVESLDVDFYDENGNNQRKTFDGYCICDEYSDTKIYLVDKKKCDAYKMMTS
jgi:hypothetical protein